MIFPITKLGNSYLYHRITAEAEDFKLVLIARAFGPSGLTNWYKFYEYYFNIRGKLSVIRCNI